MKNESNFFPRPGEGSGTSESPGSLGIRNDFVTRAMLASIAYFVYDLWAMFKVFTKKKRDLYCELSN